MTNTIQAILDQKIDESFQQIKTEKSRNRIFGSIEMIALLAILGFFFAIVYFIFWGSGYSIYASAQHDYTVAVLIDLPGPQRELVEEAMVTDGYVSLFDYRKYVEMANDHKKKSSALSQ